MEDSQNRAEPIDGAEIKSPFLSKFENFWYHYKWHSIIAAILLITVTVLSVQMCTKESYDIHIIYAGDHEIKKTSQGGNISPYRNALSSFKKVTDDFDDDGNVNINLLNLFIVNTDEASELLNKNPGMEINETLVREDTDTFDGALVYGEHYLVFLSERLYLEAEARYEGAVFMPVAGYVPDGTDAELCGTHGVYLRSLPFYSLPEICNLPDDTVVCLRKLSEVSTAFGKKENEKNFKRAETVFKNILAFN